MTLTNPPVSLTNPRQGNLAAAAEAKLVLEWQDGLATDLGFRQQKMRLSFARGPLEASTNLRKIKHDGGRPRPIELLFDFRIVSPQLTVGSFDRSILIELK